MEVNQQISGTIFDIQGFSVHDGPGARSLIFLKGCSLNCFWCCNPEGISKENIPLFYASRCIGCGNCETFCPNNAIQFIAEKPVIDRTICEKCHDHSCLDNCYTDALRMSGRTISVDELFSIIQRDRQFWGSEGGITLTGGEPLLQIDFAHNILKKCYESYIHTAIETCGNVPWKNFELVIDHLDWIFFDLKQIDPKQHETGTGTSNTNIINNVRKLNETFNGKLIFRLPFIPGFNSSRENLAGIASLILETKWKEINLLPLHHLGRNKYQLLGLEFKADKFPIPSPEELQTAKEIFEEFGLTCFIGQDTPF
ncbi:MAG: glycyl-radical enzyme activating protein [Candidatus Cloacimonadales bacterium]|nr:glycyl-radical enzyme activating protein [Candidatus Cloacimonadales bacterium]